MRDRSACGSLTLLLDENLSGRSTIDGLASHGIPVKSQTELMARGVPDEEVLRVLAQYPDCVLLSKDSDFHKKPMVKEALIQHGVGAFIITAHKNKTGPQLVELIHKAWSRIQKFVQKHPRPFVAKILADGHIEEVGGK